jgi:hypothetical protein
MAENFDSCDSITEIRDTLNEVRDATILLGFMLSDRSTKEQKDAAFGYLSELTIRLNIFPGLP